MSRAMLWTVLGRMDGQTLEGANVFDDARTWAVAAGVSDGTDASGDITREQMITILYRYTQNKGIDTTVTDDAILDCYSDTEDISSYAYDAMTWAVSVGVINGTTAITLSPNGTATRAEVAVILLRYLAGF